LLPFSGKPADISSGSPRHRFPADRGLPGSWKPSELEGVQLRLYGAEVTGPKDEEPIEVEVYANLSSNEEPGGPSSPKYAGKERKASTDGKTILSFNVIDATRRLFSPGTRASFSLVLTSKGDLSWEKAELALFIKE